MTDKVIVYTDPKTGILAVCIPAPECRLPGENEGVWLDRVRARSVPAGAKDVRVMLRSDLPKDRTFRDAWAIQGGKPSVDMAKAKDIHRGRIRRRRKARFRDLDAQQLRAIESGDASEVQAVAAAKKKLRDAPAHPGIENAKTPEELKTVWPL